MIYGSETAEKLDAALVDRSISRQWDGPALPGSLAIFIILFRGKLMSTPDQHGSCAVAFWATPAEPARLSNEDWALVEPLFTSADTRRGRPRRSDREILDAILWVEANADQWRWLPASFPPAQTCYIKYLAWRRDGLLEQVKERLERITFETEQQV